METLDYWYCEVHDNPVCVKRDGKEEQKPLEGCCNSVLCDYVHMGERVFADQRLVSDTTPDFPFEQYWGSLEFDRLDYLTPRES